MAIDDNTSYELTGYQVKDLASKIRAKADSNSLASVATSGLYSDLTGAPTIPTVYNGTLTIQQNGTTLGTFSANQSANETINITGGGGASVTTFYTDNLDNPTALYKDSLLTTTATFQEVYDACSGGPVRVNDAYTGTTSDIISYNNSDHLLGIYDPTSIKTRYLAYASASATAPSPVAFELQKKLTAGSNITISSNTISATDTTYSAFTGATSSVAGSAGLVPAPTTSDPDKFLKGDGTWATPSGGSSATTFYWKAGVGANAGLYKDSGMTIAATLSDVTTAMAGGLVYVYMPQSDVYETAITKHDSYPFFTTVFGSTTNSEKLKSARYSNSGSIWTRAVVNIQSELTAGSNISISGDTISATDTTYSDFTGATSSVAGAHGLVPAPAAGDEGKALHGDGTWKDTTAKLVEMSYGESNAWAKFLAAYQAKSIVYCGASSNANPGTGAKTRRAFMAYVNDETTPTEVEFQYVRSVGSKTSSQPVDQVFVYKLTSSNGGTWSVQTRDMAPKIAAGTGINVSYSNGTYTISLA